MFVHKPLKISEVSVQVCDKRYFSLDQQRGSISMINSVEDDEFDVQSGLQSAWAVTFCILYILVMVIRCVDISRYI